MYVDEFAPPIVLPFNFHWYVGDAPAFVGVAVNVTGNPGQVDVVDEVILAVGF